MTTKKMTKRDYFQMLLDNYDLTDELVDFVNHQIDLLNRKSGTNRKPTPTQLLNVPLKDSILFFLTDNVGKKYTITDLIKTIPELKDMSNQKISNLTNQLVKDDLINKEKVQNRAYFFI